MKTLDNTIKQVPTKQISIFSYFGNQASYARFHALKCKREHNTKYGAFVS